MITRRELLKWGSMTGAGAILAAHPGSTGRALAAPLPGGTLDPTSIPKYRLPLVVPPAMPRTSKLQTRAGKNIDYYEIAVRQFGQQILPPGLPATTVWGYGSVNHPGSFFAPSFTIEAKADTPVRVKWVNGLVDSSGNYLPHLLPVDPTLHWANPPGPVDSHPMFMETPGPYRGPVPIVTHVHGAHVPDHSDGYPEAWYLPAAKNLGGYARKGSHYASSYGFPDDYLRGAAVFQYPNDQRAATLWYHDHSLGITRLNVYAGPAGFYLLRGGPSDMSSGVLPGPAPALGDPPGVKYYEIPIVVQDRSFNADGSLFYPDSREFFDDFEGPYDPDSDVPPIWNPEFFGNTMMVNGRTWPYLDVEPRRYRLRLLNGCNSRFLILKLSRPGLSFWQIGSEGGFLPAPVQLDRLLLGPAERADVVVDFSKLPVGTHVVLWNLGPDEPFGGGQPGVDFAPADPATTGQVMLFRVVRLASKDASTPPPQLALPKYSGLGAAAVTRRVSLNENDSETLPEVGPAAALLGTESFAGGVPTPTPLFWSDPVTENPVLGATEVWEVYNHTMDAHPIHLHLVQFQVVNRQPFGGAPRPPERWESGYKDTVIAYPGEVTRIRSKFDLPGLYVWHCHILEHEDNEMMRPYVVGPL